MNDDLTEFEEQQERTVRDTTIFWRLLKYIKPYVKTFAICFLIILVSVPLLLYINIAAGNAIDILRDNATHSIHTFLVFKLDKMAALYCNIGYILIAIIINVFCIYYLFYLLRKAGELINWNMRKEVFSHIEYFSNNQFNSIPVGKLVTRVTSDIVNITNMYVNVIVNLIRSLFTIIIALVLMLIINIELTLYLLMAVPFIVVGTIIFIRFNRKAYRQERKANTEVNSFLSEHLSGVKITQIFAQQAREFFNFRKKTATVRKYHLRSMYTFSIFRPYLLTIYYLLICAILYFGMGKVIDNFVTIGQLIAMYELCGRFFDPLFNIAEQFDTIQSAFASAEKIFAILDNKIEIVDQLETISNPIFTGSIEFKNVWFAYNENEWVLKGISFKINPKDTIAFIGATGAGKTTILSLITRNYEIQKGQILIDGIDIKQYKLEDLRKNIGQMLQDVFLFSGSIKTNISLRNPKYTDEDIKKAAHYVNADQFISKLKDGYNTEVYERGNNFSVGERQLLSFARTILTTPKIMILDEATANIDTETELLIQDSLHKMMNISTMLIVAHRLSTIKSATTIYVIDKGQIIESGNHNELINLKGRYYELYKLQYQDLNNK